MNNFRIIFSVWVWETHEPDFYVSYVDPMKSQVGYLDVVVPPDILDYPTSTDMVVKEGSNITLKCAATGQPQPVIMWRREGGEPISLAGGVEGKCMGIRNQWLNLGETFSN